jgi:hypothetical protein
LRANSKKNWLLGLGAPLLLLLVLLFLLVLLGICSLGSPAPIPMLTPIPPTATPTGDWKLVWSDEFDGPNGSAVDTAKWSFDVGCGRDETTVFPQTMHVDHVRVYQK